MIRVNHIAKGRSLSTIANLKIFHLQLCVFCIQGKKEINVALFPSPWRKGWPPLKSNQVLDNAWPQSNIDGWEMIMFIAICSGRMIRGLK